ncbi:MAG TPA: CBO0543 family protein [Paenibacillus sp.]|uniref:CBO0543 family protein n=1 Tax=Paenibacillus sp. TaxID=58172 RepID=UPI002C0C103A|nr:CBO0543 family protein [Paenibacillus sp.]HUC91610.1 CBO0543 family protein [Paenibacillus sp.]
MHEDAYFKKDAQLYDKIAAIHDEKYELWIEQVLFSWQWWVGVLLTVVPWVLWLCFRKKESTYRLLLSGLFIVFISSWLDFIGISAGKWHYHYDVLPLLPSFTPWDFSVLPVLAMFLIQIKPKVHPFLKGIVYGAISAFAGEPIFIWLELYTPENWKTYYSFPIFVLIYLSAHWLSGRKHFAEIKE